MALQPLTTMNCTGLLQPCCSLLPLDSNVFLFGQKGWPKRSCPTGVFSMRLKNEQLKLRAIGFSNNSCYLPPLRSPAITHLNAWDPEPESYLIHGGRTPNNEISGSLYLLSEESHGCNRKVTLQCREKELVGDVPEPRYGHTMSVVHNRGKRACVLFGGRSYRPPGERTTETWNSMVDCPPHVFLIDLEFGCCSAHVVPELTDGQSFHLSLAREDRVYILGGHTMSSDSRPMRLFCLRVELLQGSPIISCNILDGGLSLTSAIAVPSGSAHEYIILGGYQSETQKHLECSSVILDDAGIHIESREPPAWTSEIRYSRTWFGGSLGKGCALIGVPTEGRNPLPETHNFYKVSFKQEGDGGMDDGMQGCSQESTDFEDSAPLEDSEELYFSREPHEMEDCSDGEGDTYNEEDEEDESQTGYWVRCCLGCRVDPNTWEPYYSTELHRPAMIFCSRGEDGHWVHAQCMDLPESLLMEFSQNSSKYFCLDHGGLPQQDMKTPPRTTPPIKRPSMKTQHRKAPIRLNLTPAKKSFLRRLFE